MASGESPSSLPFASLTELADALPPAEPAEQVNPDVLCDIEDPLLFQAVLTRLESILSWDEWREIAYKLMFLSPRSFIVALAAGEFKLSDINAERLRWMLRDPNPYILNHPTMMHEVRELDLTGMQTFPSSLHHFTSLCKLDWISFSSLLPDDSFSLVRQHLTGLQDLVVNTPRLTTPMLNDIAQMTNLVSLKLYTVIDNAIPPLGNLRGLTVLTIVDWGRPKKTEALILPSTLEGLTRIESLDCMNVIIDDLAIVIPAILPSLRYLRLDRELLSEDVVASLRSHYLNKEGFKLVIR